MYSVGQTLIRSETREASEQLALILVIVCRVAALDHVRERFYWRGACDAAVPDLVFTPLVCRWGC